MEMGYRIINENFLLLSNLLRTLKIKRIDQSKSNSYIGNKVGVSNKDPTPTLMLCHVNMDTLSEVEESGIIANTREQKVVGPGLGGFRKLNRLVGIL